MCIRDSLSLAPKNPVGLLLQRADESNVNRFIGNLKLDYEIIEDLHGVINGGYDISPVSYTHLRAHETVLDLVCRLLLEKKKTIKHSIVILCPIINSNIRT